MTSQNSDALRAIGAPGGAVRLYIRAAQEQVAEQLRDGEVAIVVAATGPATIRPDGTGVDPASQSLEQSREAVRAERWSRLLESDWTQVGDSPLSEEARADWRTYRQALRDIFIDQPDATPDTVIWPEKPST